VWWLRQRFKKDQRLNIRISSRDLKSLQARALEEGIPYQTFAASLLHKFVSGHLVDQRGLDFGKRDNKNSY
jgi:predicted DNA binding CopG/RHH family protein